MSSLIQMAMDALNEAVATEARRFKREGQMATLNVQPSPHDNEPPALISAEPTVPLMVSTPVPPLVPVKTPSLVDKILAVAEAEWQLDIVEPVSPSQQNGAARIDQYIRGSLGLGWNTAELGPTARPNIPYTKNGMYQWCGAFCGFVFGNVGLGALIRKKHIASTYRLWAWSNGNARRIEPKNIQPGDIVVVGPVGSNYGEHVTLCAAVNAGGITTYEGNASGPGPKGDKREGVIKRTRAFRKLGIADRDYCVMFGVRPLPEDYV